jgi:hypothetical protein
MVELKSGVRFGILTAWNDCLAQAIQDDYINPIFQIKKKEHKNSSLKTFS